MAERQDKSELLALSVQHEKQKRGWGRPLAHDALDNDLGLTVVKNLASCGMSQRRIAAILGMSWGALKRRFKSHPPLYEAYKQGKVQAHLEVQQTAYALAVSGMDPGTTRWMSDKLDKEVEALEEKEEDIIDVTPQSGPMTRGEIEDRLQKAYEKDPMLRPDDETQDNSDRTDDGTGPRQPSPEK